MQFTFRLRGTGWAEATIEAGGESATATVSYLSDNALGDLLAAVAAALGPSAAGTCSWQEEPGEYAWTFTRAANAVRIAVEWYAEWRALLSDQRGTLVFDATVPAKTLGNAIAAAAERVLHEYGEAGYVEKLAADPFPHAELARLRAGLRRLHATP